MRNRLAVLAAVLAFALVVGGLGVLAARSGSDSGRDLPRLPFATAAEDGASAALGMKADAALAPYPAGGMEYRIGVAMPDLGDHAAAYRRTAPGKEDVATLAEALGIRAGASGGPTEVDGAWMATDGSHSLRVDQRTGQWFYSPEASQAISSGVAGKCAPCPPDAMCAQMCEPPSRPDGMPTKDEAERTARALWAKAGVRPADAKVVVDDNFSQWYVHFTPQVDGREVAGMDVSVVVGPKRAVESASGWLGGVDKVGDYPLISLQAAVDRLNASMTAGPPCLRATVRCLPAEEAPPVTETTIPGAVPVPLRCEPLDSGAPTTTQPPPACQPGTAGSGGGLTGSGSAGAGSASTGSAGAAGSSGTVVDPPPTTIPGTDGPPPRQVVVITGARLALQSVDDYLVPVYVFAIQGGGETGPIPAVPDRLLKTAAPAPADQPTLQNAPTTGTRPTTVDGQDSPKPTPAGKPAPPPAPSGG
jgi:hypothetical protein